MTTKQPVVEEAKAQVTTQTAAPPSDTTVDDVLTATPAEPSPAQTPLVPPPGTRAEGSAGAPEPAAPEPIAPEPIATPPSETSPLPPEPFADELPPDFWGDALEPPSLSPTSLTEPPETLPSTPSPTTPSTPTAPDRFSVTPSEPSLGTTKPLEGSLQKDPRFVLLQELFPGHISDWQAKPVANGSEHGEDGADVAADAPIDPETVDLEEGLDADETVS